MQDLASNAECKTRLQRPEMMKKELSVPVSEEAGLAVVAVNP
jgi:hypothetical protein